MGDERWIKRDFAAIAIGETRKPKIGEYFLDDAGVYEALENFIYTAKTIAVPAKDVTLHSCRCKKCDEWLYWAGTTHILAHYSDAKLVEQAVEQGWWSQKCPKCQVMIRTLRDLLEVGHIPDGYHGGAQYDTADGLRCMTIFNDSGDIAAFLVGKNGTRIQPEWCVDADIEIRE